MPKSKRNNRKNDRKGKNKKQRHVQNNRKQVNEHSEIRTLLNEDKNKHSLDHVLKMFRSSKLLGLFSGIKSKGFGLVNIFFTLIILKFLRIETVNGIYTSDFKEVEAGKDVFYDFKNNPDISWRKMLLETAKIYKKTVSSKKNSIDNDDFIKSIKTLHVDDSDLAKRGLKIEGVGSIWSHAENRSIIGYKILVLGFWDGKCFIPIDFSLHREKGKKLETAIKQVDIKRNEHEKIKASIQKDENDVSDYQKAKATAEKQYEASKEAKKECKDKIEKKQADEKIKEYYQLLRMVKKSLRQSENIMKKSQTKLKRKEIALQNAQEKLDKIKKLDFKYGLSKQQRAEQQSKKRGSSSEGAKRYAELNSKKNKNAEKMIRRAVYHGFVPDYVLADSWFFSYSILVTVRALAKGDIHYLGMAKMGNILYSVGEKEYNASELLKNNKENAQTCRKIKARYIIVSVKYKTIDLNLMFVRLNGTKQWRLLVTTDEKLTFVKAIEIYQIRWSIEVFFKDTKQHLGLGKCQSNDFDAQIADNTIVMMRYIMLSLHKRIHYQQSIGGLFKDLSDEMVEANLAQKLWSQFVELQLYIAGKLNIDFENIYNEIKNDKNCNIKLNGVMEIFDWFYRDIRESVDVPDEEENRSLAA